MSDSTSLAPLPSRLQPAERLPGTPQAQASRHSLSLATRIALHVVMILVAAFVIFPFVWMLFTSIKPESDVVSYPPRLFPEAVTWENYIGIWTRVPFGLFFRNTVLFAGLTTAVSLLFDAMAAYALARLEFRGRETIFLFILATMMVSFQMMMVPLFITVFRLGWINTLAGLIVPRATSAFGIFLLRQSFITIPRELDDAARIDGCSEFRIFWQIILPLARPALATLAVFHFMYNWNDFLWPLLVTTSIDWRTIPAGLALFMGAHVVEYAILMAGATIALAPLLIAFIFAQQYFVRGIAFTGLKE